MIKIVMMHRCTAGPLKETATEINMEHLAELRVIKSTKAGVAKENSTLEEVDGAKEIKSSLRRTQRQGPARDAFVAEPAPPPRAAPATAKYPERARNKKRER